MLDSMYQKVNDLIIKFIVSQYGRTLTTVKYLNRLDGLNQHFNLLFEFLSENNMILC